MSTLNVALRHSVSSFLEGVYDVKTNAPEQENFEECFCALNLSLDVIITL